MNRSNRLPIHVVLAVLLFTTVSRLSPQQEITIRIKEGMPTIPVAMPEFTFTESSVRNDEIKNTISGTLWNDLDFSRVFRLIPKEHYSYIARFNPNSINFKDWASIQANILISGQLEITADDRIIVSVKVYEVGSERFIFGRNLGRQKGIRPVGRPPHRRRNDEALRRKADFHQQDRLYFRKGQ